jgi:hypothetical protein
MSGIEFAGLAFGVLPVLIEAVKAYSYVSSTLHTFRHYSKEVKSIRVRFRVHHGIFLNECRLLLRLIENEQGVKDMLEDESDKRWYSKAINDKFNNILKDNFELCCDIIAASKDGVAELNEEMRKFDELRQRRDQVRAS